MSLQDSKTGLVSIRFDYYSLSLQRYTVALSALRAKGSLLSTLFLRIPIAVFEDFFFFASHFSSEKLSARLCICMCIRMCVNRRDRFSPYL